MAKSCPVVIGANYGDEGKGLITDKIVSGLPGRATVIRYNSSAQAGHTVVLPDGRRHVFHHVGSGAFAGAATFLSRFFVSHPMLLGEELEALRALGAAAELFVDPRSPVATPYDVLINQIVEQRRGAARHGSCGIGFNETVERSLRPRFFLGAGDLGRKDAVRRRLRAIRDEWVPRRLRLRGITDLSDQEKELFEAAGMVERFLHDIEFYRDAVRLVEPGTLPATDFFVFEGAQGLALDEDAPGFPHLTRSKTGLANVVAIARETDIAALDVVYVTRAYLTRHGAGPLPGEHDGACYPGFADPTNRPNAYQGRLRFADLDLPAVAGRIGADLAFRADGIRAKASLAVTCLDQIGEDLRVVADGPRRVPAGAAPRAIAAALGLPLRFAAHGPTRDDVRRPAPQVCKGPPSRRPVSSAARCSPSQAAHSGVQLRQS